MYLPNLLASLAPMGQVGIDLVELIGHFEPKGVHAVDDFGWDLEGSKERTARRESSGFLIVMAVDIDLSEQV